MMSKKLDALRDAPIEELESQIVSLKVELSKEKAQTASGTRAEKPAKIRDARRQIARVLTIINERKIARENKAKAAKAGKGTAEKANNQVGQKR